ncbi:MAG: ribosome recycling factor, partial [Nanoarchaeota archaeon]|nr:ribosome recycling factor [Nanoarchaeota archaeon]MBU1855110.1 ribosome recycling factor [Nanoarchaeota archaeon]
VVRDMAEKGRVSLRTIRRDANDKLKKMKSDKAISEDDETNNEANNTFIVEQFHIIAGTTNDELRITDASYVKLFTWSGINLTDSNVYVADTDSNIEWGSLQAVGRNTTNETTTNDFEEIDIAFGSTSFTDSINKTYTNAGSPKLTQNFTVFSKNIGYVPVVNSTNTSDFVTGLLWDYSDGNVEFNATQDLLLITRINQNKTGKYGTYDYEIKVPAPLRSYKGATNMVTFYTEII